ncbi:serine aminopeptidase domain-containing protein [Maribacter antarcticus]|uniref:serine aminopeptidase domain-containing protein n=1 Tax=Maribacter antarcticus TaxID=505250 RepID=UPI00047C555D|nr:alpha/beta hydrolase [Maribacter antarcticus]
MVDYRGFGKSMGRRTQKAIKRDLQVVYNKLRKMVDEKYIILYGRSLGSGFAAKLASMNNPMDVGAGCSVLQLKQNYKAILTIYAFTVIDKVSHANLQMAQIRQLPHTYYSRYG